MNAMLPSLQAQDLQRALVDYLTTTFALADQPVQIALTDFLHHETDGNLEVLSRGFDFHCPEPRIIHGHFRQPRRLPLSHAETREGTWILVAIA